MATTDTRENLRRAEDVQARNDNRLAWTIVALIVLALAFYAAYATYYQPDAFETGSRDFVTQTTPATTDGAPTTTTTTQQ